MKLERINARDVIALLLGTIIFCGGCQALAQTLYLSRGQTVYVPIYSSVIHGESNDKENLPAIPFANILSIRNTNINHSIVILHVKYYDADGNFLRDEKSTERPLGPLASTNVFVSAKDISAGQGGSFVVEWESDTDVNAPIIEGINMYSLGMKMTTFAGRGQPVQK